jgi:hypothetical protein
VESELTKARESVKVAETEELGEAVVAALGKDKAALSLVIESATASSESRFASPCKPATQLPIAAQDNAQAIV